MIIIILNFILFPIAIYALGTWINISPLITIPIGLLLASVAFFLNKTRQTYLITWLKSASLVIISLYALIIFSQIGFDLLTEKSVSISVNTIVLATVLIFALFIYYLLLSQEQTTLKTNLDKQIDNIILKPSIILCLLVGLILTVLQMLLIGNLSIVWLAEKVLQRGIIPPLTLLLFNWGLLLLFGKYLILFKITDLTKLKTNNKAEFWQIVKAKSETFYVLPGYINYALPILGFIGTVLGISLSSQGIANIISSSTGLSSTSTNLGEAIAPLGIAFDTTLIALSLSLVLSLVFVLLQSHEVKLLQQLESNDKQQESIY